MPRWPMFAVISCTKPQASSAKTTPWCLWKICRFGICPSRAKGTKAEPGKRVKAKSGLNRAILAQGWYEFRRQLQYKLDWLGGNLFAVPPQYSSQTCPECGHIAKENRRTQASFACVQCGFQENADFVGARNILRAGLARLACEVSGAVMPPAAGTHRSDSGVLSCS